MLSNAGLNPLVVIVLMIVIGAAVRAWSPAS